GNLFKPGEPVAVGFTAGTPLAFPENNGTNQRENKNVEIVS
ncbi:MAG: spermidine/putrescine ABC transporter ATP-binding protein, partial [Mesorhizobium sp.]